MHTVALVCVQLPRNDCVVSYSSAPQHMVEGVARDDSRTDERVVRYA